MSKFKCGDKVKLNDTVWESLEGQTGTVIEIYEYDIVGTILNVKLDNMPLYNGNTLVSYTVCEDQVELYSDEGN